MHEICAPSDTIMLKSDSYGQKYLSRQYHKIKLYLFWYYIRTCLFSILWYIQILFMQLNFIDMTFALSSSLFFAMGVFGMCVESYEVFKWNRENI